MSDSHHTTGRAGLHARVAAAWRVLRGRENPIEAAIREADETEEEEATDPSSRRRMLLKVAEFDSLRVKDVMIPRADIVAIDISATFEEAMEKFAEATVSRMPVYRGHLDDPAGVIHIKDMLAELRRRTADGVPQGPDSTLTKLRRDILFVPPSMRLSALLVKMQAARSHIALVIDEYGGTHGLVTIEDLVEQIVGDIEDEHDESETPLIRQRAVGVWEADARTSIEEFSETSGLDLALEDRQEEIDTLGGLVFTLLGRVPQRGEIVRHPTGAELQVLEADPRRITRVQVRAPLAEPVATSDKEQSPQGPA